MRKGLVLIFTIIVLISYSQDQDSVGKVTSEEIIIEKDKEIVLPRIEKLYETVEVYEMQRDPIYLKFSSGSPQFNIAPFSPQIRPHSFVVHATQLNYQNFFKLGYGSYGSSLLSAYAGEQNKRSNWGAWLHHEGFAQGVVRGTQSASSTSIMDVFSTFQNKNWILTPRVGWQKDSYRFYGYNDLDPRITNDKNSTVRFRVGAVLEEINDNNFTLSLSPVFKTINQNTTETTPTSSENFSELNIEGSYSFDSTFSAGMDMQLGAISFTSKNPINRNFTKVNPWFGLKREDLFIKVGMEFATTNDTLFSSTKRLIYPDMSAEWSGLLGWTMYGEFKGQLKPVTYWSLSQENLMLDDSLTISHENVKSQIKGGIRGAITSKLHLNSSIQLSVIKNMSFFTSSISDSAQFTITVNPDNTTIFKWAGILNWQPLEGTHLGFKVATFSYGTGNFPEAWYRPSFTLSMDWIQRYSEKITSRMSLNSLAGLKALGPITFEVVNLKPIFDLNLETTYKINERVEVFIQFQNVFGQEYQRFLNYPSRGIAFKIGGLYRF